MHQRYENSFLLSLKNNRIILLSELKMCMYLQEIHDKLIHCNVAKSSLEKDCLQKLFIHAVDW